MPEMRSSKEAREKALDKEKLARLMNSINIKTSTVNATASLKPGKADEDRFVIFNDGDETVVGVFDG